MGLTSLIFFFFFFLILEGVTEFLPIVGGRGPCKRTGVLGDKCAGGETWLCRQETLIAGSWYLRLRFLSVKPRAGEQMHPEVTTPLSAPGSHCVKNCLLQSVLVPVRF